MWTSWRLFAAAAAVWLPCFAAMGVEAEEKGAAPSNGELVPLEVELPEPPFECFAGHYASPNLEEPSFEARRFLVPKGTVNLSRGKPVAASVLPRFGELEQVTDGVKDYASLEAIVELDPGTQWVQVDLGVECVLQAVVVWHYYLYGTVTHDVIVEISNDAEFSSGVLTLYNNDWDGSSGLGEGTDKEYVESYEGRLFEARGARARYVRIYGNGSHINQSLGHLGPGRFAKGTNHYLEVEVFGKAVEAGP